MEFETQILHSVRETDQASWDSLSKGHPFASYCWYQFGEAALSDNLPIYIILAHKGEPVARATLWLRRQEQLPVSSRVMRRMLQAILRRWPLLMCQSPVADAAGLILPEPPLRDEALKMLAQTAQSQLRLYRGSFLSFVYLESDASQCKGWPADWIAADLAGPGTRLHIRWTSFEEYLRQLGASARKDYRRHTNRAADLGIEVKCHPSVTAPDQALALIRNVEEHHDSHPNPWARSILDNASKIDATWLTAEKGGELVGCGLLLRDGPHAIMRLLGRDYRVQYAYFQLLYRVIRCAIEQGIQVLWGGTGAYEMKQRLGFQLSHDTWAVFAARSLLLQRIGRWAIGSQ